MPTRLLRSRALRLRVVSGMRARVAVSLITRRREECGRTISAASLVPRPPRPSAGDGLGALVEFLGTGARFWPDPIRSLDFAYHTIITLQITCGW